MFQLRPAVEFWSAIGLTVFAFVSFSFIFFYYFQPSQFFEQTLFVGLIFFGLWLLNVVATRITSLDILDRVLYFTFTRRRAIVALALVCTIFALGWFASMFDRIVERFQYLSLVRNSIGRIELGARSLPSARAMAAAFSLYPNRREVPFLVYKASRMLVSPNDMSHFKAYMTQFVTNINIDKLRKSLDSGFYQSSGAALFYANAVYQTHDDSLIRSGIDNFFKNYANVNYIHKLYWEMIRTDFTSSWQRVSAAEDMDDADKRAIFDNIEAIEVLIAEMQQDATTPEAGQFASHVFQEALDSLGHLYAMKYYFSRDETDIERSIEYYKKVIFLRDKLTSEGDILWFSGPRILSISLIFEHFSGYGNEIADNFYGRLEKYVPQHVNRYHSELYARPAFEKYRKVEAWDVGTPGDPKLRNAKEATIIEQWLKEDW